MPRESDSKTASAGRLKHPEQGFYNLTGRDPFGYHKNMAAVGEIGVKPVSKNQEKLKEPEEYQVILLNDHYTTMDFVVDILIMIFHKDADEANRIMLDVHKKGKGIVGIYPWDIAATKVEQVHAAAREYEFPLRCIVEPA